MTNYSKWDSIEDSDDDADDALERAQALNERGSGLLAGKGSAAEALECLAQARKLLIDARGKPISSEARDLAGGVLLNAAVASDALKRYDKVVEHAEAVLALEPTNPYDGNAKRVVIGNSFVGYLPREDNVDVARVYSVVDTGSPTHRCVWLFAQ